MQKSLLITGAALGFLLLGAIGLILGQKGTIMAQQSRSQVYAPEFPPGLPWLNTDQPLTIASLRGKAVLLDFWTYCCINCMHIIPDLKALEKKYPNELVVIGVHSAKFINERGSDNIRQAILRYEIEHPVVNDYELRIWRAYGVRAWPTLALIDPSGYVIGGVSGEGNLEVMDHVISELIQSARAKGALDETPRHWALEKAKSPPSPLAFPGKVLADEASGRLFIADSNHHRVVIADLEGNVLDMAGFHQIWVLDLDNLEAQPFAGSGREDIVDGHRLEAAMAHPSGLATDGKTLYVADSETSSIRAVDLGSIGTVKTIIGEGLFEFGDQDGTGSQVQLQHPLGVTLPQDRLYVADTYNHKIKIISPHLQTSQTYLGRGRPGINDGQMAEFYEPGGLSIAGARLYIADTNNHAIRIADLASGEVSTLKLTGLTIPDAVAGFEGMAWMDGEVINMPSQTIKSGAEGQLVVNFQLPTGYMLNPGAPVSYAVYVRGDGI